MSDPERPGSHPATELPPQQPGPYVPPQGPDSYPHQHPPAALQRQTGKPQLVIGTVIVALVVLGRVGEFAHAHSFPSVAETLGLVAVNGGLLIIGIVLIVVGARRTSAARRLDQRLRYRGTAGTQPVDRPAQR